VALYVPSELARTEAADEQTAATRQAIAVGHQIRASTSARSLHRGNVDDGPAAFRFEDRSDGANAVPGAGHVELEHEFVI
jgi:hypothetical protein